MLLLTEQKRLAGDDFSSMAEIGIFVMAGAILHIIEDAVCGKVPLIYLTEKVGVKLFSVGSFSEYFFSIAVVCIIWIMKVVTLLQ